MKDAKTLNHVHTTNLKTTNEVRNMLIIEDVSNLSI